MAAVLAIFVLKLPDLGTESIGDALEWVFYVTLPNFCFSKALQDMLLKHQYASICSQIGKFIDRATFCKMMLKQNQTLTNICCPGELQNVIFLNSTILHFHRTKSAIISTFSVCRSLCVSRFARQFYTAVEFIGGTTY